MPIPGLSLTDKEIFPIINVVLPAWVLLVAGPRWKITKAYVNLAAAGMCLLYALLIFSAAMDPSTNFISNFAEINSWEGVARLLSMRSLALPCWVHYIAFDLWTGRWISLDAASRSMPRLLLAPILFFTLMLGPIGLLMYLLVRGNWRIKYKSE